ISTSISTRSGWSTLARATARSPESASAANSKLVASTSRRRRTLKFGRSSTTTARGAAFGRVTGSSDAIVALPDSTGFAAGAQACRHHNRVRVRRPGSPPAKRHARTLAVALRPVGYSRVMALATAAELGHAPAADALPFAYVPAKVLVPAP